MFLLSILLIIGILFTSWYAYRISFFSPKSHHPTPDAPMDGSQYEAVAEHINRISSIMQRIPFEEVTIKSFDGTTLYGRYYHQCDGAPVEILTGIAAVVIPCPERWASTCWWWISEPMVPAVDTPSASVSKSGRTVFAGFSM